MVNIECFTASLSLHGTIRPLRWYWHSLSMSTVRCRASSHCPACVLESRPRVLYSRRTYSCACADGQWCRQVPRVSLVCVSFDSTRVTRLALGPRCLPGFREEQRVDPCQLSLSLDVCWCMKVMTSSLFPPLSSPLTSCIGYSLLVNTSRRRVLVPTDAQIPSSVLNRLEMTLLNIAWANTSGNVHILTNNCTY